MADLVVVVPSRGRPWAVAELAETFVQTCSADTWLLAAVDADDPTLPQYQAAVLGARVIVHTVAQPAGHVGAINAGAAEALRWKNPHAIAKLDDDHRPRTRHWDAMLLAALDSLGGTGIAYGNDLLQGAKLPTAPAMSADIVRALGFMGPPTLTHLYVDDFWRDLGEAAGCLRYVPEVVIEHMHPFAGKAPMDEGYERVNDPARYAADQAAYRRYLGERLAADAATVRALRGEGG